MRKLTYIAAVLAASAALASCEDSSTIGSSVMQEQIVIEVDSAYTVEGSVLSDQVVQARTTTQLLGRIEAPEYGRFESDFVTQFMPAVAMQTEGVGVDLVDSLRYVFSLPKDSYVGDSIVPMGLEIYPLVKQLPSPIYSDFDPSEYYDHDTRLGATVYNASIMGLPDTLRYFTATLPRSLAVKFYEEYVNHPSTYQTPEAFAEFFPGMYVRNSYGQGRVVRIPRSLLQLCYRKHATKEDGSDTIISCIGNYWAVTPEVVTNNNIRYTMASSLRQRAAAGEHLIVAPTGLDVVVKMPARQLVNTYRSIREKTKIVNTLTFSIPADTVANKYGIGCPPTLLMVLSNKKDEFFAKNTLPDNETSFIATYNSATHSYTFSDMRGYLLWLLKKDEIADDDFDFTLTAVTVNYESGTTSDYYSLYYYGQATQSQVMISVVPYIETPAMTRLDIAGSQVTLTYTKQNY